MFRTSALTALGLAVATMPALCAGVVAAAYPHKPLRLIVPTATGGSTEVVARLIGTQLAERLKTQVVVDNRGGARGASGVETAAKAAAAGHTLLLVSASQMTLPALRKLPYDPVKSFVPIAKL